MHDYLSMCGDTEGIEKFPVFRVHLRIGLKGTPVKILVSTVQPLAGNATLEPIDSILVPRPNSISSLKTISGHCSALKKLNIIYLF